MLSENSKTDEKRGKIKNRRTEILLGFILIAFVIYKFSLYNYFSFVVQKDAKLIIRDFERNYYYSDSIKTEEYNKLKRNILDRKYTTKEKLDQLFQTAKKQSDDKYTTFSYADISKGQLHYNSYQKVKFESKSLKDNIAYVKFNSFTRGTSEKFYKALDKMEDKEYLIIDLRKNNSGDYSEAVKVADMLLPEGFEICNVEFMNSNHNYKSDAFLFNFKKIFVFLDEKSASSSELLALTLKENISNKVELIGKTTSKKSVGMFHKNYYNKISLDIITMKWTVKGKQAETLEPYMNQYKNVSLDKLDDYLNQTDKFKNQ